MISSYQFFYVLIGKEGVARKLILLFQLSWINQESVICGSQHFFHPAEEALQKPVFPGALVVIAWDSFLFTGIAAIAPSENVFMKTSRDGAEITLKQAQMVQNGQKWR